MQKLPRFYLYWLGVLLQLCSAIVLCKVWYKIKTEAGLFTAYMVFFSLPIFLLILTVPTSHRMYLCPRQHQPHQKSQGQGLRLSFTFGFPVSKYFVTSCCRIQNSTSGYIRNDPECNLNLDPQVAASPCATNSLSEFSQSVCVPCNFTEKKKPSEQHHTSLALLSGL